ncbi:hypothetical protein G9C98_001827 [Cotesia typhae]|uniref:Sin3 histone deacetylase corepressor complex component SDS3 n=1 Tax=Cotesia typhae TaxID=2053667 RepID=A0A8J5RIS1_9HYME|nr:hypothetical protein G9C98_001827 [Cotesia typhae]
MGKSEEMTEIKEQVYQDKLGSLKKQLQQLNDGSHPEFIRKLKRLESQYQERLRLNIIHREYLIEWAERDYVAEKKAACKEFEEKKIDLKENLLTDMEEKKKMIESDRQTMELTVPEKVEKRRKPPPAQLNYLLDEKEIENDLKAISRGKVVPTVRKQVVIPHFNNPVNISTSHVPPSTEANLVETRIEDGKLWYERRWYHRGQPVYVEGMEMSRFGANIAAIGTEVIWVKKVSDGTKVRICISQLSRGRVSLKRRAS